MCKLDKLSSPPPTHKMAGENQRPCPLYPSAPHVPAIACASPYHNYHFKNKKLQNIKHYKI